jgi:ATP-dependent exoDNAse (exonuclease V) beta subunit
VAATRARDLLVVPAVGDEELDGWLAPLNKAIYPERDRQRHSTSAEGCPHFGESSVVDRPFFSHDEFSVRPGMQTPRSGNHTVVWWDPHAMILQAPANLGLRQEEILSRADPEDAESPSLANYRQWQAERSRVRASGEIKQFDIFTATETLEKPTGFAIAITHHSIEKAPQRPSGARFGALVHIILRDAALDADRDAVTGLAEVHARMLGATDDEREHAVDAVFRALRHPFIERSRQSTRVRREFPVLLKLEDSRVLDGVIDLLFEANGRWQVVDFKTDADVGANRARYERQVQWYALAVSRLNQAPVDGHLLSI